MLGGMFCMGSHGGATSAPAVFPRVFHSAESQDRCLRRLCPVGTYLRPVLDILLDMDPNRRRMAGSADILFDTMKAQVLKIV